MNTIQRAVMFAAEKHKAQLRKGTNIPYIVHPLGVMEKLIRAGASNNAIVAGILHDTLEDTATTYDELVQNFGARVADIVAAASESDKSLSWEERKNVALDALRKCDDADILAVVFADKTHNLQSIHRDWNEDKDDIWTRFKRGCDKQMWYYGEICEIAKKKYESVDLPLRTLMCDYWWEYDNFVKAQERWARLCGCGDDREYTREEEAYFIIRANELVQELQKDNPSISKTLLEQYHELALRRMEDNIGKQEDDILVKKMKELKSKFSEQDWEALIYSCPVFMRPMLNDQKKKYLSK